MLANKLCCIHKQQQQQQQEYEEKHSYCTVTFYVSISNIQIFYELVPLAEL